MVSCGTFTLGIMVFKRRCPIFLSCVWSNNHNVCWPSLFTLQGASTMIIGGGDGHGFSCVAMRNKMQTNIEVLSFMSRHTGAVVSEIVNLENQSFHKIVSFIYTAIAQQYTKSYTMSGFYLQTYFLINFIKISKGSDWFIQSRFIRLTLSFLIEKL